MDELSPSSFGILSTPERAEGGKKGGKKREEMVEEESGENDTQKEHRKENQKDIRNSEEDNDIALEQLDLMQTMIPEETSLPSAEEDEEEKYLQKKKDVIRGYTQSKDEPQRLQKEVNKTGMTEKQKWTEWPEK